MLTLHNFCGFLSMYHLKKEYVIFPPGFIYQNHHWYDCLHNRVTYFSLRCYYYYYGWFSAVDIKQYDVGDERMFWNIEYILWQFTIHWWIGESFTSHLPTVMFDGKPANETKKKSFKSCFPEISFKNRTGFASGQIHGNLKRFLFFPKIFFTCIITVECIQE